MPPSPPVTSLEAAARALRRALEVRRGLWSRYAARLGLGADADALAGVLAGAVAERIDWAGGGAVTAQTVRAGVLRDIADADQAVRFAAEALSRALGPEDDADVQAAGRRAPPIAAPAPDPAAEGIARAFHALHESLAPRYGYATRPETAGPWEAIPRHARWLLVATARGLLDAGHLAPPHALAQAQRDRDEWHEAHAALERMGQHGCGDNGCLHPAARARRAAAGGAVGTNGGCRCRREPALGTLIREAERLRRALRWMLDVVHVTPDAAAGARWADAVSVANPGRVLEAVELARAALVPAPSPPPDDNIPPGRDGSQT